MKLHLPKLLLTAVLAAVCYTPVLADSVSVNFYDHSDTGEKIGTTEDGGTLFGVNTSDWNDVTADGAKTQTVTLSTADEQSLNMILTTTAATWGPNAADTTTLEGKLQSSYLDVSKDQTWKVVLDTGWWLQDVTFYMAGDNDTGSPKYTPISVNGVNYKGGVNQKSSDIWGSRITNSGSYSTVEGYDGKTAIANNQLNADNAVRVTSVVGQIVATNSNGNNGRGSLAGMQVVDVSNTVGYFTTLGEGETSAASATWTINGASATYGSIADAQKNLGIRANEKGSTLVLTGGETVNSIAAVENTVTIKADSAVNLSAGLYVYEGAEMVLDAALTGTNNVVSGKGSITINSSSTFSSITTANLTIGGNVELSGSVNVAGSVALTQGGYVKVTGNFGNFSYQSLDIAAGSTLQLKGGFDGARVFDFTGNGTIELDNGGTVIIPGYNNGSVGDTGTVQNVNSTSFAGNISVKSGLLVLGDNSQWQGYWGLDLSSLKSIDLDGGNLKLFGAASTVTAINVNNASSMTIQQASVTEGTAAESTAGKAGYTIGTLNLNKNLDIRTNWRSVVEIGTLKGAGDLFMDTAGSDRVLSLYINNIDATLGMDITFAANVNAYLGGKDDSVLSLGGVITNSGNLTLDGAVTILGDETKYTLVKPGSIVEKLSHNDGLDGYQTTSGSSYLLIDNNGGSVDLKTTEAVFGTVTTTLTKTDEGDVTFVGGTSMDTVYRVNTQDITIGGSSSSADTGRATAAIVATGRTVTIAGASDAATAEELLVNSTGEGNITLSTNVQLGENDVTKVKGKLSISEGATLTMGNGDSHTASISSFNTVELDGGKIYFKNKQDTFHNLTVTAKNGTFELFDMGQVADNAKITMAGTTTLNGNLTYINTWNSQIDIEKVSGTGKLIINGKDRDTRNTSTISINGVDNFTGSVHITNKATSMKLNVVGNLGLNVYVDSYTADNVKNELDFTGIGAGNTITLQGARGYLTKDSTIAANLIIENSSDGSKAGLEINDGYSNSTNNFAGTITGGGNLVINKQDITNVTQKFTGDISGWKGNIDIAGGEDHRVLFTGDTTTINNGKIFSRKADGRTVNTGATVTFDHEKAVTVNSELKQEANSTFNVVVMNSSEAGTTFTKSVSVNKITVTEGTNANFNGVVSVSVLEALGNVSLTAQDVLNVTDLTVGQAGELTIVGSIDASGAVTLNGGATINAAVVDLSDASSVSFDVASGAIALNGALTMSSTEAFVTALGNSLAGLTAGDILTVFTGVSSFTVGGVTYSAESENQLAGVDLSTWDSDVAVGQYTITYNTFAEVGSIVITVGEVIPEPASATLSLAALMMLCARRRRRK